MKKIILFILLAVCVTATIFSTQVESKKPLQLVLSDDEEGVTWYNFTDGYSKAVKEGKIILIDAYTDWCGWCKVMDKKTYTDAGVIEVLNKNFVCVKLNPEQNVEYTFADKTMKADVLLQFLGSGQVTGYPSTIFWPNPATNQQRYLQAGYMGPSDFLALLDAAIQKGKEIKSN